MLLHFAHYLVLFYVIYFLHILYSIQVFPTSIRRDCFPYKILSRDEIRVFFSLDTIVSLDKKKNQFCFSPSLNPSVGALPSMPKRAAECSLARREQWLGHVSAPCGHGPA